MYSRRAPELFSAGYEPIPCQGKAPVQKRWSELTLDETFVQQNAELYPSANVGLRTRFNPAIDIDVLDEGVADALQERVERLLGAQPPIRVGNAPKRLLVCRTGEPFPKRSMTYVDLDGRTQKVEVLADGQQFIAFGVHPDTRKQFRWVRKLVRPRNLPVLSREQADEILEIFADLAEEQGWTPKGKVVSQGSDTYKSKFESFTDRMADYSSADVEAVLAWLDDNENYDAWLEVGAALHHQYAGQEEGLELWDAWSATSSTYDPDELDSKYRSFSVQRKGVTLRTLVRKAQRALAKTVLRKCKTKADSEGIQKELAPLKDAKFISKSLARQVVEKVLEQANDRGIKGLKSADFSEAVHGGRSNCPEWAEGYVYLGGEHHHFFDLNTRYRSRPESLNSMHGRDMLEVLGETGKPTPSVSPAAAMLNWWQCPQAIDYDYLPGGGSLVSSDAGCRVNTWQPPTFDPLTDEDASTLEDYFYWILPPMERQWVQDFCAHVIQRPGYRIQWCPVLIGPGEEGKTTLCNLLTAAVGRDHIESVAHGSLEGANVGYWLGQCQVVFFEEMRIAGRGADTTYNNLKAFISNNYVGVNNKYLRQGTADIRVSYVGNSNYPDALPLTDEHDRRFGIFKTPFNKLADVRYALEAYDPDLFTRVYDVINNRPGAVASYFRQLRISDQFSRTRAPWTQAKQDMCRLYRSGDVDEAVVSFIEDDLITWATAEYVDLTTLRSAVEKEQKLSNSTLPALLYRLGYTKHIRIRLDGRRCQIYYKPSVMTENQLKEKLKNERT